MATQTLDLVQAQPTRRRFTVDEYYAMVPAGILRENDRVELIDGEIVTMSTIGDEHHASVDVSTKFLVMAFGDRAIVRVQGSVRLDDYNQPQPDFAVLKHRDDYYRSRPAGPTDTLLPIEVADTSLSYDRRVKLPLYARFAIPEFWIVNIPARTIEVYTVPVDGEFTSRQTFRPGQTVTPSAFADVVIPVSDIVGRSAEVER